MAPDGALLFIPDISGFSRFVTDTEIRHSRQIIAELLTALIDANRLGLVVSEIEGDAVLFYRRGPPPSLVEVAGQAEAMFLAFHALLLRYERDRICDCAACSTTRALTLKFIVHWGPVSTVDVRGHEQLVGRDVIVAHRLLKNPVGSAEYLLATEAFLATQDGSCRELETVLRARCTRGASHYDVVGEVGFVHVPLTPLLERVAPPPPRDEPQRFRRSFSVRTRVFAPLRFAYDHLADLGLRHRWMQWVRGVEADDSLPRIGSAHRCFLPGMALHVETSRSAFRAGSVTFVEKIERLPFIRVAYAFATLTEEAGGHLRFEVDVHYRPTWLGVWAAPLLGFVLHRQFRGNALGFKRFVEARAAEVGSGGEGAAAPGSAPRTDGAPQGAAPQRSQTTRPPTTVRSTAMDSRQGSGQPR